MVNETTGEVYGHVVSVDALGEAYVIPIQSTLLDIQTHLGAREVCLPTMAEVFYLRSSQDDAVSTSTTPTADSMNATSCDATCKPNSPREKHQKETEPGYCENSPGVLDQSQSKSTGRWSAEGGPLPSSSHSVGLTPQSLISSPTCAIDVDEEIDSAIKTDSGYATMVNSGAPSPGSSFLSHTRSEPRSRSRLRTTPQPLVRVRYQNPVTPVDRSSR